MISFMKLFGSHFPQISAVEIVTNTVVRPGCIHPALISPIGGEFSHAIDFYRNIIEMQGGFFSNKQGINPA